MKGHVRVSGSGENRTGPTRTCLLFLLEGQTVAAMSQNIDGPETMLRAAAKRHPRCAVVALAIFAVYAVSAVWGAGYGVGKLIALS